MTNDIIIRINTARKEGGLGNMKIPLLADISAKICHDYGVYIEAAGIPLRFARNFSSIIDLSIK